jgi:hypothetical protein
MSRLALTLAPHPTERQQRINEIKQLLAEDGFVVLFPTTELVQQMAASDPVKYPGGYTLWWGARTAGGKSSAACRSMA